MIDERRELKWTKQKALHNKQFDVYWLFDDAGIKRYLLICDKNQNLLKIEEYHDDYTLQIDQDSVVVQVGKSETEFTFAEILHPASPKFDFANFQALIQELQKLNLAQIYFGVKKQSFTNTEANENLMNYVHFSRHASKNPGRLLNINQQLFKENDLWLDLSENIRPVDNLIYQYQKIEENQQLIEQFLQGLNSDSLLELRQLFKEEKKDDFSKSDLLNDTGWKLAGAAAELLVADRLQMLTGSISFHNLILPFDYGSGEQQNQIDNLLINSNGIFCIEVKSKMVNDGLYNFDKEEQQAAYVRQVINHQHAVKRYLLEHGLFVASKHIHPIILVMNRNSDKEKQNFKITNSLGLIKVISLQDLANLSKYSNEQLSPDKINQISQLLQASDAPEPKYDHYIFLPKLTADAQSVANFNLELQELNKLMENLRQNLERYYKAENYQKLIAQVKLSSAFKYFTKHTRR